MKPIKVDPDSPVPLYHQIAEAIRTRIEAGDLAAGDALVPLREAARTWGVNLHTVRHAYTALARDGLVESRGPNGTRVTAGASRKKGPRSQDTKRFIQRIVREARDEYGLDAHQLLAGIAGQAESLVVERPVVHVVECSVSQSEAHAQEIETRFNVDAREWSLEREEEPPPGCIIATYFHYNDIRRLWPHRLREVRFLTIVPDRGILDRLPSGVKRILVFERDEATAETVAADLSVLLGSRKYVIEPVIGTNPVWQANRAGRDSVVLVAPRVWSSLSESARTHDCVMVADYVIDVDELEAAGRELGWPESTAR